MGAKHVLYKYKCNITFVVGVGIVWLWCDSDPKCPKIYFFYNIFCSTWDWNEQFSYNIMPIAFIIRLCYSHLLFYFSQYDWRNENLDTIFFHPENVSKMSQTWKKKTQMCGLFSRPRIQNEAWTWAWAYAQFVNFRLFLWFYVYV